MGEWFNPVAWNAAVGQLTGGSNPPLPAISSKSPKIGTSKALSSLSALKMDTFNQKMDTFNLYKYNNIYYFRIRIEYKLYRKSLKTSNLKKAIIRAKLLKSMKKEDLKAMFEINDKGMKLLLEYDTPQELEKLIEYAKHLSSIQTKQQQEDINPNLIKDKNLDGYEKITFQQIYDEFIANKKRTSKLSLSSFRQYNSVFNKLNLFFRNDNVNRLNYKDFEEFRNKLIEEELNPKTINNIVSYTKNFLDFATKRNLIEQNSLLALDPLKEEKSNRKNFNDEQVIEILKYVHQNCEEYMYLIFITAAFTGMSVEEIIGLKEIKNDDKTNIRYFDITKSKSPTGIRKVPLHPTLLGLDYSALFEMNFNPLKDMNKLDKRVLKILYMVIEQGQGWVFHSFRGTVVQKLMNIDPLMITILMDTVGHSQQENQKLTIETYGKEFSLENKLNLISKLSYT